MHRCPFVLLRAGLFCALGSLLLPAAASAQTGSLTGTVRASDTGQPIAGASVAAYNSAGTYVGGAFAGADGVYYTNLTAGTYYLVASRDATDYESQLHANIEYRYGITSVTSGTPVAISAWQTTTVHFSLRPLGHISGSVTSAATGAPIPNLAMAAYLPNHLQVGLIGLTNAAGEYTITGLNTGTYYVRTYYISGFYDQIYSGVNCSASGCPSVTAGTSISVAAGTTTPGIDFSLVSKGFITGAVRDAVTGTPIVGAAVIAHDTAGNAMMGGSTDASGVYIVGNLNPGTYYLRTLNSSGYLDELYDDIPCVHSNCTVTEGRPVSVTLDTPGRADFTLATGGLITGIITAANTGAPIPDVYVQAYNARGELMRSTAAPTDASGRYTINGLSGTYYLQTVNPQHPYFDQIYAGINCLGNCRDVETGTPVSVAPGDTTPNINFALQPRAVISGTVTTAGAGTPIANVTVYVYDSQGVSHGSGSTDASGTYTSSTLGPGTYFVRTSNSVGYLDQLYDGIPCVGGNCIVTNGTPIELTFGSSARINFALNGGGSISGTVKDTRTSAPLDHYWVQIYNNTGVALFPKSATNSSGQYTFTGLAAGIYYVRAFGSSGYVDQIFSGVNCGETCPSMTTGTAVTVSQGGTRSNVNFWLVARGAIAGRITAAATGQPLSPVTVRILNASGQVSALAVTDGGGYYVETGLAPASYFITTRNGLGYVDQLHSGLPCAQGSCVVTTGTAVAVASAGTSTVDFSLQMGAPTVTNVWPWHGPPTGATSIRLTGQGFVAGATTVTIGGVEAADVTVISETELTATTPPGTPGQAAMVVRTNVGTVTLARGYTYDPFRRYFAEGASSGFFDCYFALLNPSETTTATVTLTFLRYDSQTFVHTEEVPPLTRRTVDVKTVPGLAYAPGFSTIIESNVEVVADRTMTWDSTGYGSHAETAIAEPATTWYLAEGATQNGFQLYYLIQNPNPWPVDVTVTYLRRAPNPPFDIVYPGIPGYTRKTIFVNQEDARLVSGDVSGIVTSTAGGPIIVERAMYLNNESRQFNAGHAGAGVTAAAADWFLAEGATVWNFDMYVLLANPGDTDGTATLTYMLTDGRTMVKSYPVAAQSRQTVWVNSERDDADPTFTLQQVSLSTMVHSTVPIIVERAMWWSAVPGGPWVEAHDSVGTTETGTIWAVADGEQGGTRSTDTYVLVANTSPFPGRVRVTAIGEDGSTTWTERDVPAHSRSTFWTGGSSVTADSPFGGLLEGKKFGAIVESVATAGGTAQIVVERAMYSNANGVMWTAGTDVVATRLK